MKNAETGGAVSYHDDLAQRWEVKYESGGFARRCRFFATKILPLLPTGGEWLDAGCGTGTFSRLLAQDGRSVLGVDASQNMLHEAERRRDVEAGETVFRYVDTIERLPFPDRQFDGIICLSVIEYLEKPFDAIEEMTRVLIPGATVVISVPNRRSILRLLQRMLLLLKNENKSNIDYLSYSIFSTDVNNFSANIKRFGLVCRAAIGFDPIIPSWLHPVLKPSLIYFVCQKV